MIRLLLILLFCSGFCRAETIPIDVQHRPPEMHIGEDGAFSGPLRVVLDQLLADAGLKPVYQSIPWKRSLITAKQGTSGLLVRHSMNRERLEYLRPILLGFEERTVWFLRRKDSKVNPQTFDQLLGLKVGVPRGSFMYQEFTDSDIMQKVEFRSDEQLLKMLSLGRIDLAISNRMDQLRINAKSAGMDFDALFEPAAYRHTFFNARFMSVPLASPLIKHYPALNRAAFDLRKSGFITRALKDGGAPPWIQDFDHPESIAQQRAVGR